MFKYSQDSFCLGISPKNVQVDSYTESIDLRVFFLNTLKEWEKRKNTRWIERSARDKENRSTNQSIPNISTRSGNK